MKRFTLLSILLFSTLWVVAQDYLMSNGGFENWSTQELFETPNSWLNSNQEQPNMISTSKNNDAFDGNHSLHLESVYDAEEEEDRFGYAMLGDPNDDFTGIPYNTSVDSLIAHVKYNVQAGDSATILVIQFINGEEMYSTLLLTGISNEWTRIAMPLNLPSQDSILIAFASGNGLSDFTIAGSMLMVDQVSFVSNSTVAPVLPNASFEDWTMIDYNDPTSWLSRNNEIVARGGEHGVTKITDSHSGDFAVSIEHVNIGGNVVESFLTNGEIENGQTIGVPFYNQPETFEGYYKFHPVNGDFGSIQISFFKNGEMIESAQIFIEGEVDTYTKFTIDLNLTEQPDKMYCVFNAGSNEGTQLILDDIGFAGGTVDTREVSFNHQLVFSPNPTNDFLNIKMQEPSTSPVILSLVDVNGKVVFKNKYDSVEGNLSIDLSDAPIGVYWLQWKDDKGLSVKKVVKQ